MKRMYDYKSFIKFIILHILVFALFGIYAIVDGFLFGNALMI